MRIVLVCLLCACTAPPFEPDPPVTPPEPLPEWLNAADGTYFPWTQVSTDGQLASTTLRAYVDAPGATLFALAEAADVPALATLRAAVSADDSQQLEGWFDEALSSNALGVLGVLGIAESIEHLPPTVLVESELTIAGATARHRLAAIYFEPSTFEGRFPLGDVGGEIVTVETTAITTPSTHGGQLDLGGHELSIAFGDYAWRQLDLNLADTGGVRGTVGGLTLCGYVATTVASKCSACGAQVAQLAELCERGLDEIVDATRAELSVVRVRFVGGSAALVDRTADRITDELTGTWEAQLDLGAEPAAIAASFSARRSLVH